MAKPYFDFFQIPKLALMETTREGAYAPLWIIIARWAKFTNLDAWQYRYDSPLAAFTPDTLGTLSRDFLSGKPQVRC